MAKQKKQTPKNDIQVRLPVGSDYKDQLLKIAKENHLSMNTLIVKMIEWFLQEREKGKEFAIKLK